RHAGLVYSHHDVVDHGSRCESAALRCAVGRRATGHRRLVTDDSGSGGVGVGRLPHCPRGSRQLTRIQEFLTRMDSTTSETSSIALSDLSIASTMSFHLMTSSAS